MKALFILCLLFVATELARAELERDQHVQYELLSDVEKIAPGEPFTVALRMLRTALGWEMAEQPSWSRPRWGTGAKLEPAFALDHGL